MRTLDEKADAFREHGGVDSAIRAIDQHIRSPLRFRHVAQCLANLAQYYSSRVVHDFAPSFVLGRGIAAP